MRCRLSMPAFVIVPTPGASATGSPGSGRLNMFRSAGFPVCGSVTPR